MSDDKNKPEPEPAQRPKLPPISDDKWRDQERFIGRNNRDRV